MSDPDLNHENEDEDIDDDEDDSDEGEKVKFVTNTNTPKRKESPVEKRLFTKDEMKEREKKRLQKSACCMDEVWELYNKLTDPSRIMKTLFDNLPVGIERDSLESALSGRDRIESIAIIPYYSRSLTLVKISQMSMAVTQGRRFSDATPAIDQNARQRMLGLQMKYQLFGNTLGLIKEAPSPPFLRIGVPISLDNPGRNWCVLNVMRSQITEMELLDIHPCTIASRSKLRTIANANFISPDEVLKEDAETTAAVWKARRPSAHSQVLRDGEISCIQGEQFEHTNYPLDHAGNPIGKTTGDCHYCGNEILPIPTYHLLSLGYDRSQFYCCKNYRSMIEEIWALENTLRKERDAKNFFIDISPHGKYNRNKSIFPGFVAKKKKGGSRGRSGQAGEKAKKKKTKEKMEDNFKSKSPVASRRKIPVKKQPRPSHSEKTPGANLRPNSGYHPKPDNYRRSYKSAHLDTLDLPWDPYETFYGHERMFQPGVYDKPLDLCYRYPDIVLNQSELYDWTEKMNDSIDSTQSITSNTATRNSASGSQRLADSASGSQRLADSASGSQRLADSASGSQRLADSASGSQRLADEEPSSLNVLADEKPSLNVLADEKPSSLNVSRKDDSRHSRDQE